MGDPAIVLRCGVATPKLLAPQLTIQFIIVNGKLLVLPDKQNGKTVFTIVGRSVYIDVTMPSSYPRTPLGPTADAVLKVLPRAVCVSELNAPLADHCTRRD